MDGFFFCSRYRQSFIWMKWEAAKNVRRTFYNLNLRNCSAPTVLSFLPFSSPPCVAHVANIWIPRGRNVETGRWVYMCCSNRGVTLAFIGPQTSLWPVELFSFQLDFDKREVLAAVVSGRVRRSG